MHQKTLRTDRKAGNKWKRKDCGKTEETRDFLSINLHKSEMMPERGGRKRLKEETNNV
jgi:hypothetical protein